MTCAPTASTTPAASCPRMMGVGLGKTPSATLYMGLIPFVTLAVIALLMVTYIPAISLWILKYLL